MLLQLPCPKCGTTVDVEPQSAATCPNCQTSVVGWIRKTNQSEDDRLPKHMRRSKVKGGGFILGGVLVLAGIICFFFDSIWIGLILIALGAILEAITKNA